MARVQLKNVEKTFNKNKVLKGINVEVPDGSFMVMVGPSGCGKSTALRCIAGLEEVTGGSIFIGDEDVTSKEPKDRNIAMVFQNYALYPHMNVFDNITYGLKVRGIPADERKRRAEDAAKLLGLDGLLDRMPKQLSGGQRQRVAMGRAIVREPSVFLFDEPLSNLDANLRNQMRIELRRLHQRLATTSMTKEISGFTNTIKNAINRTGFGFVFSSDNAQYKGRNVKNITVYKARNLLSNGNEFEPIYKTLVVTYIERMLRFYSGDFKQDKILTFFSNNPNSQKSRWDADRQYVNSILQDGDELDFSIDEKNGVCDVLVTFANTTKNLKVQLTRKAGNE